MPEITQETGELQPVILAYSPAEAPHTHDPDLRPLASVEGKQTHGDRRITVGMKNQEMMRARNPNLMRKTPEGSQFLALKHQPGAGQGERHQDQAAP
jgi:hypothetical protein